MTWKLGVAVVVLTALVNLKLGVSREGMLISEQSLSDHWSKICVYYSPFEITQQLVRVERSCDLFIRRD